MAATGAESVAFAEQFLKGLLSGDDSIGIHRN